MQKAAYSIFDKRNLNIQPVRLILQIAIGVFLGCLTAQLCLDKWHEHQQAIVKAEADKVQLEREQARKQQAEHIRQLLLQGQQKNQSQPNTPPPDFIPDDAESSQVE